MKRLFKLCAILVVGAWVAGCGGGAKQQGMNVTGSLEAEPNLVTVQHVLIAFEGTVENVTRSREAAEALAMEIFERAKHEEDFDALMEEYSDDRGGGIYGLVNDAEDADEARSIYPRKKMAQYFGDVAFTLDVGEVGLAHFDPNKCKFGWHVIKRIR